MIIKKETLQFLKELKKNNSRDWFNQNKDQFVSAQENFVWFVQKLISEVGKFDSIVQGLDAKKSVFRIYRDTRFSKDKTPYKTNFGASLMGKEKNCSLPGYYIHLEPGNIFLAGGVYMTEPINLKRIREEISNQGKEFLKIINDKKFKNMFTMKGDKLVKVPAGFDKEDPMGEYLKYKQLIVIHSVEDKIVQSDDFISYCVKIFKAMFPLNSFLKRPMLKNK